MLRKSLFLLITGLAVMNVSTAQACRCVAPTHERDVVLIEEADAIVTLDVLESEIARGEMKDIFFPAKVKLRKVYKGDLEEGQTLTIWSGAHGSCTNTLSSGAEVDLLLYKHAKGYILGAPCSYLSAQGWEKLKQGEK